MSGRPLRDVVRHTLIYGLGSVGTSLIGFVLIPVYTRFLTPADYGLLALVLLFQAVVFRFYDLGLTNSVGRFFFDYQDEADGDGLDRMASTTILFHLVWGSLLSLAIWLAAPAIADLLTKGEGDPVFIRIISVTLLLDAVAITPLTLVRMEERSGLWVALSFVRVIGALGLNILFVVFMGLGVKGILLSSAIASGAVLILILGQVLRHGSLTFDGKIFREMLSFGLPFMPVLLGVLVIDLSDRFILDRLRDTTEVGIYSLGYKFGQVMMIAVSAFSMGWAPLRYKIYPRPDAKELYARISGLYAAVALTGVVALGVWGHEVVWLAATEPFFGAAAVIPWIALAYVLYGMSLITTTGMGVTKKTGGQATVLTVAAVLNVGLNLLWIPGFGMMGAAVATVVTYVVVVAGTYWYSQRVYALDLPWTRIVALTLLAGGVVQLDRVLQPGGPEGVWKGIALGGGLLVAFMVAAPLTGVVRWSEVRAGVQWARDLASRGGSDGRGGSHA